jgi:hypothetical protein
MKRLFTFGCSFTQFMWPTWADIIASNNSYDLYENWGRSGSGNLFIFNSIIECNLKRKFTVDDDIFVMWATIHRDDGYRDSKWTGNGGVPAEVILTTGRWDMQGYQLRDMAFIYAIDQLMASIGCNLQMMATTDLTDMTATGSNHQDMLTSYKPTTQDIIELYTPTLNKIHPSVHKVCYNNNWRTRPRFREDNSHPGPGVYMEYLEKIFGPGYISDSTKNTVDIWEKLYVKDNWELPARSHLFKRW